jgi:hypothetical protein
LAPIHPPLVAFFGPSLFLFTPFESKTQIYMVIDDTFPMITNYAIYFFLKHAEDCVSFH